MLNDVIQAERDQEADCARIDALVHLAERDMSRARYHQEISKHWSAIRDRTVLTVRDVRRNIVQRADEAKQTLKEMTEAFFRENSIKAPVDYSAAVQDIPTRGLLYHLQYLIRTGELQRVQGIRDAFEKRSDRHPYVSVFEEVVTQCVLSGSEGESGRRLARICRLAKETDAKLIDLWFRPDRPEAVNGIAQKMPGEGQSSTAVNGAHIPDRVFENPIDIARRAAETPAMQTEAHITITMMEDNLESAVAA